MYLQSLARTVYAEGVVRHSPGLPQSGYPGRRARKPTPCPPRLLVPKIPFVVCDLMPFKQCAELVLKADAAMMRLLPRNVSLHRCALGLTDGKGSVSGLPLKNVRPLG